MQFISVPDYYAKFKCIGPQCEDTCCSGWSVTIDRDTYHKYKENRHKQLAPIFKQALGRHSGPGADHRNNFGLIRMKPDGTCPFQQADKLCAIQCTLGAQALSDTCMLYPRYLNQFGPQRENALGISCPQAARLILLNPQPMQFEGIAPEPAVDGRSVRNYKFPTQGEGDPPQMAVLNDFRAVIIAILQCRQISLGARVMTLGFLLAEVDRLMTTHPHAPATLLSPTLAAFAGMLAQPAQLEEQFSRIAPDHARKLETMTQLIANSLTLDASARFKECLLAAAQGLDAVPDSTEASQRDVLGRYQHSLEAFYQPFFQDRQYIFENYLVNQVMIGLFPFTRGSYLDLYREMVFNLSILQVLLVGMAAHHQGLDEARVIQLFQSFARKSDHNASHLDNLLKTLCINAQDSFVHVMWLLA